MSATASQRGHGMTAEQQRAVATRDVSVSLSAGAGCGKTFVLTERFLAHLDPRDPLALKPDEIGQLVAITFTERAAREMRERIRRKCYARLHEAGGQEADYWAELLRALDHARISTIHSFCATLLRTRAVEAGIDPQFGVLEQAQAETLLTESIDDALRRMIGDRDETILELAVRFRVDELRAMIRVLIAQGTPERFDAWLAISPDEQVARWQACWLDMPPVVARSLVESHEAHQVRKLLHDCSLDNATMRNRRAALLEIFDELDRGPAGWSALVPALDALEANARVQGGGGNKGWPSEDLYEQFKKAAEKLRRVVAALRPIVEFDAATAAAAAVAGGQLLALAERARRAYAARKQELRVMDFDDLLVKARALLVDRRHRGLVEQLGARLTLLLVDEFQDTDSLQVELVEALCGRELSAGKLFFVGDHKQSIYRFRGAEPHVFRQLRSRTPEAGRQSLTVNFRSQPAILDFVNALFADELDDYEPLLPDRKQVSPLPAVEFLWAAAPNREPVATLRRREADWIARRIRGLLDAGGPIVWDARAAGAGTPAARPAEPGDVAILLRALGDVEAYESALRDHGIDYYLVGGHAFYAQQEIFDLVNLLRTLNSPADVVSLIGALRSGFFSLADETIYWLAQHSGGLAAGLAADSYLDEIEPAQQARCAFAARTLARLRASKDRLRVSELIDLALSLTGYDAALLNEFLGERKLANLLKLEEQARGFQRGDFFGLADFITQLSEFVVRQPNEPLAATHSEDTNVVRIMTVHQAKGLEFPIVVVPDVNRKQIDPPVPAQFDARLGPLVRMPADDNGSAAAGYELWRELEKPEEAAEMRRLLYVATTRAADYLILSAGVNVPGETGGPWTQLLARRFDLTSGQLLGRLPEGKQPPPVKVTSLQPGSRRSAGGRQRKPAVEEIVAAGEASLAGKAPPVRPAVEPIEPDRSARRQYSFSRLSGALRRKYERLDEVEFVNPQLSDPLDEAEFIKMRSADPRGLGTLVHAALAVIDFAAPQDCRELVERLADSHAPDRPEEIAAAVDLVERFVASFRARDIATAQVCHTEIEFLLGWPPDASGASPIVLRGYLDRLYQDAADGWHVLDFKTNRIAGKVEAVAANYEMQMLVYGLAAERILGVAPASLRLHFLRTGGEHEFAWNDAARRQVVTLVDQAIAAEVAAAAEVADG